MSQQVHASGGASISGEVAGEDPLNSRRSDEPGAEHWPASWLGGAGSSAAILTLRFHGRCPWRRRPEQSHDHRGFRHSPHRIAIPPQAAVAAAKFSFSLSRTERLREFCPPQNEVEAIDFALVLLSHLVGCQYPLLR